MNCPRETKSYKNWSYAEGKALIKVYENRKEEYFHCRKKRVFWESILVDLEALNALASATTPEQVEAKWRSLYRAYKAAKDRGTGTNPSKFLYMREMEEIFHDSPSVSVGLVTTVGAIETPQTSTCRRSRSKSPTKGSPRKASSKKRLRKETALDVKKQYYKEKMEYKNEMKEMLQNYLNGKEESRERRHTEIMASLNRNVSDI